MALQSLLTLLEHVQLRATLQCLVQAHGDALANLRYGDRRGPFFSPERVLAPETMWSLTKASDAAASPSNDAPHSSPIQLRSSFSGDILPSEVRVWQPRHIPTGACQAPHW